MLYAVVPKEVTGKTKSGERQALNPMWNRRQCTKFNGVPYIIQRGAEAVYTKEGCANKLAQHCILQRKRPHHQRRS